MTTTLFYRSQAADQQRSADAATLANARVRHQQAADAWSRLADQARHTEELRETRQIKALSAELLSGLSENPDRFAAASRLTLEGTDRG